jgi:methylated-DNA-protein-cysteine methyltransferase-like protein
MKAKTPAAISRQMKRRIIQDSTRKNEERDAAFFKVIRSIPRGKVATYGQVAAAAGYPLYHRAVARLLRTSPPESVPWQRVLGAGGAIKLPGVAGREQKLRLQMEGVKFRNGKVDMENHQHKFRTWELD